MLSRASRSTPAPGVPRENITTHRGPALASRSTPLGAPSRDGPGGTLGTGRARRRCPAAGRRQRAAVRGGGPLDRTRRRQRTASRRGAGPHGGATATPPCNKPFCLCVQTHRPAPPRLSLARSADPRTARLSARVLLVVRVSRRAMRLAQVPVPCPMISAPAVLGVRDGLQVSRVHAVTDSAQVVQLAIGRDAPNEHTVRDAVRILYAPIPAQLSVAIGRASTRPLPASR